MSRTFFKHILSVLPLLPFCLALSSCVSLPERDSIRIIPQEEEESELKEWIPQSGRYIL